MRRQILFTVSRLDLSAFFLTLLAQGCSSTGPTGLDRSSSQSEFAAIAALEGEWISEPGFDDERSVTRFHVTCNGSVVEETDYKDHPREVLTLYYLDGERLMLTHYSILESQTRMVAQPPSRPGELEFTFQDSTTQAARGKWPLEQDHVRAIRLVIRSADSIEKWSQWSVTGIDPDEWKGPTRLTRRLPNEADHGEVP
jgi:hypothetical protein